MTLADMALAVRQDLNDLDATQYRWSDVVLDRCIARAVREYSFVWPRVQGMVMRCLPGVRAYPLPLPSVLVTPPAPSLTANAGGGALMAGALSVRLTACTDGAETGASAESSIVLANGDSVSLSITPVVGASFYNIYAGPTSGAERWNGQTELTGAAAYTITTLAPAAVSFGSSGLPLLLSEPTASIAAWWVESVEFPAGAWPPRFVPVEEQGGLFMLNLEAARLPQQAGEVMNVLYAGLQQLDGLASSLPDQDWDVVSLGAYGYACLQYGLPTSDNFSFQDGEVRDRVDDSMVPGMWRRYGQDALTAFRQKLEEIRRRRDFGAAATAQWGDIPRRWDRL